MGMTVLALVQTFTDKGGLNRPSALIAATDKSARQYVGLLRETIADLGEYRWQQQRLRGQFTSVAATLQGTFVALLGAGYAGLVKDSLWNDTRHMQIFGPVTDQTQQRLRTLPAAGPEYQYWVSNDSLYVSPTLRAGDTISCIFVSKYNVRSSIGTAKESATADDDTLVFPDNVVLRLFESKWKKQKGESGWEDDHNDAMALVAKNIIRDTYPILRLDAGANRDLRPGVIIPPGSWGV
jgi:hypothetical protein